MTWAICPVISTSTCCSWALNAAVRRASCLSVRFSPGAQDGADRVQGVTFPTAAPCPWASFRDDAVGRRDRGARLRQTEVFDLFDQCLIEAARALVAACLTRQARVAVFAEVRFPALQGAWPDPAGAGEFGQRNLVFDVESKDPPPLVGIHWLHRRVLELRAVLGQGAVDRGE